MKNLHLLVGAAACGSAAVESFVPSRLPFHRRLNSAPALLVGRGTTSRQQQQHPTTLCYKTDTQQIATEDLSPLFATAANPVEKRRDDTKKELVRAAITNFDADRPDYAEDLMKDLEGMTPWERNAYHTELNARWSFVFTGVPTIGMQLITILSRISIGFPIVDFRDVYLEVTDEQSHVKAVVSWKMFGIPVELDVHTSLRPDETNSEGTMMLEHFQGITLNGVEIPTPKSWAKTRTLEISYLDQDMMIARTAGGEPHLLLRNSHCKTEDETCDIDNELTAFFDEAREMYGERIARCLVDRDYGETETEGCSEGQDPWRNILSFDPKSLISPGAKGGKQP